MNIKMERREGMGEKKLKKRGKWKRKCFFFEWRKRKVLVSG